MGRHLHRMTNTCPPIAYLHAQPLHQMLRVYGPLLRVFWPLCCKTLFQGLKMLYIFPICSYNDACWCFVNLCLWKAHFGETRYGSFQFLLFISHLVDCPSIHWVCVASYLRHLPSSFFDSYRVCCPFFGWK